MMTDPIADMLTRIRKAHMARRTTVNMPLSKLKKAIADILVQEGYVAGVEIVGDAPKLTLRLELKYHGKRPAIQSIERLSKPGHRMYKKSTEMPHILNGYGVAIVSTSQGLMTSTKARELGVGGEVICSVY